MDHSALVPPHGGTVVRDVYAPAFEQQQLSHAKLATTEAHYLQRQTRAPDDRDPLEKFASAGM